MADEDSGDDRRRFLLKLATGAVGGGIGAGLIIPAARLLIHPMDRKTVTAAAEPIDAIAVAALEEMPVRVPLVAHTVRDAWATTNDVTLGAAWMRKDRDGKIHAVSSVCPHLGCAVNFDRNAKEFRCPCHDSAFSPAGEHLRGPAERGLDPLETEVVNGRVKVTWVRYKVGGSTREKA